MALQAKFLADFTDFYSAVKQATSQLDGLQKEANDSGLALNKMVSSLSGEKAIKDAMSLAAAVEALGGTSKLTAAELEKVGRKAAEAVEKARALKIDVPPELEKLANVGSSFDASLVSMTKFAAGLVTVTAAVELAKAGVSAFIGFMTDSVKAAAEAESSQAQLVATMASHGVAVPAVISAYQGYIAVLANTTTHSDDALTASAALLTTMGVMPREMNAALLAATNLAERFGGDLTKATEAVGKAANGQTTALTKAGIKLDETRVKSEGFAYVVGQVNQQLGGAAVAAADTYAGRLAQLGNAWDEVKESVGGAIVQNQTVIDAINGVTGALGGSTGALSDNRAVMELVSDSVILLVKALGLLGDMFGAVLTPIRETFKEFARISQGASKVVGAMLTIEKGLLAIGSGSEEAVKNLEALQAHHNADAAAMLAHAESTDTLIGFTKGLSEEASRLGQQLEISKGKTAQHTAATNQNANALNLSTENAYARAAAEKALAAELGRTLKAQQAYDKSVQELEGSTRGVIAGIEKMPPAYIATTAALELVPPAAGRALAGISRMPPALEQMTAAVDTSTGAVGAAGSEAKNFETTLKDLAGALGNVGETLGDSAGEVFTWTSSVVTAMHAAKQSGASMKAGFQTLSASGDQSFSDLAAGATSMASGALGAVSAIDAATNSASTSMNVLGGVAAGAQAGMAFGPWGAAIGAAAGAVTGFVKSARDGRQAVTEFINASGGAEVMRQQLAALGDEGERLWVTLTQGVDAGDLEEAQAAIGAIQTAFGNQTAGVEALNSAIERYGFSIEELGPAFQRQELDKQAQALYKDYNVLISAGVKNTTVTKKMADEINKYVQQASKMGVAVPSAMRPMLDQMAKMGLLTDSSGKKIKDVEKSGIKFAMSMSEGFEAMVNSVDELTRVLAHSLGVELEKTKDRVEDIPNKVKIDVEYNEGDRPRPLRSGTTTVKGYQGGTKGFEDFGAGTLVMLHGREAVVPEHAVTRGTNALMPAVSSAPPVTVIINAQGAFFDTPGDLQRLADKVNAALTAKHGMTNRLRPS